jgi:hypothetical protein
MNLFSAEEKSELETARKTNSENTYRGNRQQQQQATTGNNRQQQATIGNNRQQQATTGNNR